ncbi:MAG: flotillin-like FloA family protein, partial [Planctomycetaceae bacterium]|nr:flotillin-like FloA family protein [Planctomycetaceae bacterium]
MLADDPNPLVIGMVIGGFFLAIIVFVGIFLLGKYFNLWLRAAVTRAHINPLTLAFMSLRKVNPNIIVDAKISAVQAGLDAIDTRAMEAHYLAGGNVTRVVR